MPFLPTEYVESTDFLGTIFRNTILSFPVFLKRFQIKTTDFTDKTDTKTNKNELLISVLISAICP